MNSDINEKRAQINEICNSLHFGIGLRQHLAELLQVHPSSINNALNGHRDGPRHQFIIDESLKYLKQIQHLFVSYTKGRAKVNTYKCKSQ